MPVFINNRLFSRNMIKLPWVILLPAKFSSPGSVVFVYFEGTGYKPEQGGSGLVPVSALNGSHDVQKISS